jgi:predicted P-loop ATPase
MKNKAQQQNTVEGFGNYVKEMNATPPKKAQTKEKKAKGEKNYVVKPKIQLVIDYLNERYNFRRDVIGNILEYSTKALPEKWEILNENNIIVQLSQVGLSIADSKVRALLGSTYLIQDYNPIKAYFEALPAWDGVERIKHLSSFVKALEPERFELQFKKMLVRMIPCAFGLKFNKQAFILVGNQNSGKSTFLRFLCPKPLGNYIKENLETVNKDGYIALTQNFIINLDELDRLSKKEVAKVKQFISTERIKERLVYDRTDTTRLRVANFLGSTNQTEFLVDETGSVRFLCFEFESIDFSYEKEVDMNLVYAEAYHLYKTGFDFKLTEQEIAESELKNKEYFVGSCEMDIVQNHCKQISENEKGHFMNATQILEKLQVFYPSIKMNYITLGKALKACGFVRKGGSGDSKGSKGYYLQIA